MRRTIVVPLAVALLAMAPALALAQDADRKEARKERSEAIPYQQPIVGQSPTGMCIDCPHIATGPKERFLAAEIVDAVSPVGYVELWIQPPLESDPIEYHATICGSTPDPIRVPPNTRFLIRVWAVPSANCTGVSTTGTISFTFSNRR